MPTKLAITENTEEEMSSVVKAKATPMPPLDSVTRVLTVNAGSSSLKVALFAVAADETLLASSAIERIGDRAAALRAALDELRHAIDERPLGAVAHRVVHGGARYREPQRITSEVLAELRTLIAIDPDHMPHALAAIQATAIAFPAVPQVACFDTAFHRSLPRVAQMYALPQRFQDAGVVRYGFHGLSCEYIMRLLASTDPPAAAGRVIIAHLGNGASVTAVHNGRSVETSMGFSPAGGLVMGTRPGDLDPGVLLYALQSEHLTADAVSQLVNHDAGLLGVSALSEDMRDLLAAEATDSRAADAIALFCHAAKKSIGALVAVLGGLDTLVFTAGIGEHAAPIRQRICNGFGSFGIQMDDERNAADAPRISADGSRVTVRVMKTDEDRMLARHTHDLLAAGDHHV